jgi:alkaline phosphatase D
MTTLTRRALVLTGAASGLAAGFPIRAQTADLSHGTFTHAVASGDPTSESVILWTRFVTSDAMDGEIGWEIAEDDTFAKITATGKAPVRARHDFCVKVDVKGLQPGRPYAYRFLGAKSPSIVGLTRTAPAAGAASMNFALFSCSNLPYGWFHAYRDAAQRPDIELCIHVGDYIYEYGRGTYPTFNDSVPDRILWPEVEIISLSDYHRRYASYRDDPDLQELHRLKPFVTVWDDHELANDTFDGGAQNHDPATEGAWEDRRARAVQAYLDWMPIRQDPKSGLSIYRRYDWGDLATLMLLDTRMIGRSKALSYWEDIGDIPQMDEAALGAAAQKLSSGPLADPNRTMMGATQEAWLSNELKRSKQAGAVWQVLAQQVVMGAILTPQQFNTFMPADATERTKGYTMTGTRVARYGLPYTLDSWGGYPPARERLLADISANANNALVLSGDSHSAWACNLGDRGGRPIAVEVATTAVTSAGMEKWLTGAPTGGREAALTSTNPELAWCDGTNKGYAMVTLTRTQATATFVAVGDVADRSAGVVAETRLVSEASASGPSAWVKA